MTKQNFSKAKSKLILISLEGVLPFSHKTTLTTEIVKTLNDLCKDQSTKVVVISPIRKQQLIEIFKDVNGIGLAAENGFYYKLPDSCYSGVGSDKCEGKWNTLLK